MILILLQSALGVASAQQVELVSRVDPREISDTALGESSGTALPVQPPSLSGDGRYILFRSSAANLVKGQKDTNSLDDIFLRDRVTGITVLVSRSSSSPATTANQGTLQAAMSADGRFVAWISEATDVLNPPTEGRTGPRLFLYDRVSGTNTLVAASEYFRENNAEGFGGLAISANGRYVVFHSDAPDLFPGQVDGNSDPDVFLYDRVARKLALVSHARDSASSAVGGESPLISADGRYVAFSSDSGNLVPGISGEGAFLFDRSSGSFEWVGPGPALAISSDGRYTAFNGGGDLFLYDRSTRIRTLVNHAVGSPTSTSNRHVDTFSSSGMSADGRYLIFASSATDLVAGQSESLKRVFLYDRSTGGVTLVGRMADSPFNSINDPPKISGDGRYVVFSSQSSTLLPGQIDSNGSSDVFLYDRSSGKTALVSAASASPLTAGNRQSYAPAISTNGGYVVFTSDATDLLEGSRDLNESRDVFVHTVATRSNAAVSVHAPEMASLTPPAASVVRALSADGRYVAFESRASSLIAGQVDRNGGANDIFLFDAVNKSTILVSHASGSATVTGNGRSEQPSLSADGRFIAFVSKATDLIPGITSSEIQENIYVFDRITGVTMLVSRSAADQGPDRRSSNWATISADGRYIAFVSTATDLVAGQEDQNFTQDVFLYERESGSMTLVSHSATGARSAGDKDSTRPLLSADGRYIAFSSFATNLVPGQVDPNGGSSGTLDLFLYDRVAGATVLVSHAEGSAVTATGIFRDDLPSMSADGRYIAFPTSGGVFLYDRDSQTTTLVSAGGRAPVISADGQYVAFLGDETFFLYDRISRAMTQVGGRPTLVFGDATSRSAISADGRYVAFFSHKPDPSLPDQIDLAHGQDLFLFDRVSGTRMMIISLPVLATGELQTPFISADGQKIAFTSSSPNLVAGDFNSALDAFLLTRAASPGGPVAVPTCTLLDTRRPGEGPAMRSNVRRVLTAGGACGVPATAQSVLVQVTAVQPSGKGNLQFFAGDSSRAAGILRFQRNRTRSGNFTLPLGGGKLAILPFVVGNGTVHVVVEVQGFLP